MKTLLNRALLVASSFFIVGCSIDKQIKKFAEEGAKLCKDIISEYYKNIREMYEVTSEIYKFDYIYVDSKEGDIQVSTDAYYYKADANIYYLLPTTPEPTPADFPLKGSMGCMRNGSKAQAYDDDYSIYNKIKSWYDEGKIKGETGSLTL